MIAGRFIFKGLILLFSKRFYMKKFFIILSILLLSQFLFLIKGQGETPDSYARKGNEYLQSAHPLRAIEQYRKAVKGGMDNADIYRNLSIALYYTGFIDDAVKEMKKAVKLLPDSDIFHMELGVLYFAEDMLDEARDEFFEALKINPGFTKTYYYLANVMMRKKDYKMAWLFARTAKRLGYPGDELIDKLRSITKEPEVELYKSNRDELYIREIFVSTYPKAEDLLKKIRAGELFDEVARDIQSSPGSDIGGFIGHFKPSQLDPKIARALAGRKVFSEPVIVETEKGFHLVQSIEPFDFDRWLKAFKHPKKNVLKSAKEVPKPVKHIVKDIVKDINKHYVLHAGSFKEEKYAVERVEELKRFGFPSYNSVTELKGGGRWYNVIAGRYKNYKEAVKAGKRLVKHGYDYFITKN